MTSKTVVSHLGEGSVHQGHYVSIARVKVLGKESWLRYDDGRCQSLEELSSPFNSETHKKKRPVRCRVPEKNDEKTRFKQH